MEFKFDNHANSDNEIPTYIFVMYIKVTWQKWQRTDERHFFKFIMSIYFESYVSKTNKIYRLFLSWIAFLSLACISRRKASLLVWHPGESPKYWCTYMCNMKNYIFFTYNIISTDQQLCTNCWWKGQHLHHMWYTIKH